MQFASLLVVSVAVAGICALFYAVDSRRVFGGRYVNAWLAASLLAVLCTVTYLAASRLGQPVWLIALANTAMAAAVAAVWMGCRAFNAREYRNRSAKLVEGYAQVLRISSDHRDPHDH